MVDEYGAFAGMRIGREKWKYSKKTPQSITKFIWPDMGSNPGRHGRKPATNRLSCCMAFAFFQGKTKKLQTFMPQTRFELAIPVLVLLRAARCLRSRREQRWRITLHRFSVKVCHRPCRSSAVRRWLPTAADRVRDGQHVGFVVDKAALGQVFSEYIGFPCQSFHRFLHCHNHPGLTQ
jgi:hypothetical protein